MLLRFVPIFVLFLCPFSALSQQAYVQSECNLELNITTFEDPENCHNYYFCDEYGGVTLKQCENGLLYDGKGNVHENCNYHWAVDCGKRYVDLIPESNEYCEFKYDIQPKGKGCLTDFLKCADGVPYETPCQPGLVYDHRTHACNWPDSLEQCDRKDAENIVNFQCPEKLPPNSAKFWPYPRFSVPGDCKKYIVCVNDYPRLVSCGDDTAFDSETLSCVEYEQHISCNKK